MPPLVLARSSEHLANKGCDGVVMGCTEIPLILRPEDVEVPLLDSTRLWRRRLWKKPWIVRSGVRSSERSDVGS